MKKLAAVMLCMLLLTSCGAKRPQPVSPVPLLPVDNAALIQSSVLLRTEYFDVDGEMTSGCRYTYSANGRQLSSTEYDPGGDIEQTVSAYDASGRVVRTERTVYADESFVRTDFVRDDDGKVTSEAEYDADGKLVSWKEYGYSTAGYRTSEREYNAKGKLLGSTESEYDIKGRQRSEKCFDAKGNLTESTEWVFNGEGGSVMTCRNSDGEAWCVERCEYDDAGNVVFRRLELGEEWQQNEYSFDADGNRLSWRCTDSQGADSTESYEYTFTDRGYVRTSKAYSGDGILMRSAEYVYSTPAQQQ